MPSVESGETTKRRNVLEKMAGVGYNIEGSGGVQEEDIGELKGVNLGEGREINTEERGVGKVIGCQKNL